MSVRMALAKLAAVAAGGALVTGGAVHVAEPQTTQVEYKTKGAAPVKYVKERPAKRVLPKKVKRIRRVIELEDIGDSLSGMLDRRNIGRTIVRM